MVKLFLKQCFVLSITVIVVHGQNWNPPIGIPDPRDEQYYGGLDPIEGTHYLLQESMYDFGNGLEPYKNAGNGPYTHYIDNKNENATDDKNPYGTPGKPRITIPIQLAAGSIVELHGGAYNYEAGGKDCMAIESFGTVTHPVFIRGCNSENLVEFNTNRIRLTGSFTILENLLLRGGQKSGLSISTPSDHIVMRNCEVTGFIGKTPNIIALSPSGVDSVDFNENIIFYKNSFYNNGYPCDSSDNLHNAFQISGNSRSIWILDNNISGTAEDAIHIIYYHDA